MVLRRVLLVLLGIALGLGGTTLAALEGGEVVQVRTVNANGEVRTTRTWIADAEGAMWLEVANPERPFLADVRTRPRLELHRGGRWMPCRAQVIDAPSGHARIRALLAEKYGWADRWIGRLTDTSASLAMRLECEMAS